MNRTIPIKISLNDPKNYLLFMEQCSEIFNQHTKWAFDNKCYRKEKAHESLYFPLRKQFPKIPSAIIQSVRDTAMEAVKRSKFKSKMPVKKSHSSVRYDKRTMTLRGKQLTFSTSDKRQKIILNIPNYFKNIFESWNFCGGTISYRKREKQFYVNLVFGTETPEPIQNNNVIGIDRGIYNLVTLSTGEIINSKEVRKQQRKYLYNRRKLQAKGTPSSKRKLKNLSGKEKRFSKDFNHCVSKYVSNLDCGIFVLENLKNIRKQKTYNKKFNKWLSSWSFYQFEEFLTYKIEALGKQIKKIDPRYTSQKCSNCGITKKENRNKSKYKCFNCGFKCHSDINAAINIKNKYLLSITPIGSIEQVAINQPNILTTNS